MFKVATNPVSNLTYGFKECPRRSSHTHRGVHWVQMFVFVLIVCLLYEAASGAEIDSSGGNQPGNDPINWQGTTYECVNGVWRPQTPQNDDGIPEGCPGNPGGIDTAGVPSSQLQLGEDYIQLAGGGAIIGVAILGFVKDGVMHFIGFWDKFGNFWQDVWEIISGLFGSDDDDSPTGSGYESTQTSGTVSPTGGDNANTDTPICPVMYVLICDENNENCTCVPYDEVGY